MLKKTLKILFILGFFIFFTPISQAAESDLWRIDDFTVSIDFQKDSYRANILETIDTYFDPEALNAAGEVRRGILRYIPRYYFTEDSKYSYRLQLNDFQVSNENNQPLVFTMEIDDYLESYFLRIGEADKYIEGRNIYNIAYEAENAWRYFNDHDEFYWNITGDDWSVPIEKSTAVLHFQNLLTNDAWLALEAVCFTGSVASLEAACNIIKNDVKKELIVATTRVLAPGEHFTVAVKLPAKTVPQFDPYDYYDLTDFTEDDLWQIKKIDINLQPQRDASIQVNQKIETFYDQENLQRAYQDRYGFDLKLPRYRATSIPFLQNEIIVSDLLVKDGNGLARNHFLSPDYYEDRYNLSLYDYLRELQGEELFDLNYNLNYLVEAKGKNYIFSLPILSNEFWVDPQAWQISLDLKALSQKFDMQDLSGVTCQISDDWNLNENKTCLIKNDESKIIISSTEPLAYGESVFLTFEINRQYFNELRPWDNFKHLLLANWPYFLPLALLAFFLFLWWFWGRDYNLKRPLLVQYKASNSLSPAALAELYYLKFKEDFITAEIINLAVKKYLKIKYENSVYSLTLLKKNYQAANELTIYQKLILDKLFSEGKRETTTVSNLRYALANYVQPIKKAVLDHLADKGFLNHDPSARRKKYITWAIILGLLVLFVAAGASSYLIIDFVLLFTLLVLILILILAYAMPKLEYEGAVAQWEIQGLYHYLDTAEAERFKFGELTDLFEKLLPYAIALGMLGKWVEIMAQLYEKAPDWFSIKGSFDSALLSSFVQDFRPAYKTYTAPSSGVYRGSSSFSPSSTSSYHSSGFSSDSSSSSGSGGGFGGGGGSSW